MSLNVLERLLQFMLKNNMSVKKAKMLILGCTFKEDCPDVRNSKTIDFINESKKAGFNLTIYDPVADSSLLEESIKKDFVKHYPKDIIFDVIFIALSHKEFLDIKNFLITRKSLVIKDLFFDLKGILGKRDNVLRP